MAVANLHAAKSYINKLLVRQKRALRLIYFAPSKAHAIPFFIESNILPVRMVYFDTVANLMHDIWKRQAPLPLKALFTRSNEIHLYNTRHAVKGNYYQKEAKLDIFKHSFSRNGAIIWNKIPCDWRNELSQFLRKNSRIFVSSSL